MHPDAPEVTLENPAPEETVSISSVEGKTVVVNNKLDGSKKTTLMTIALVVASVATSLRGIFPKYDGLIEIIERLAFGLAGYSLTSPFDRRGVVLTKSGIQVGQ